MQATMTEILDDLRVAEEAMRRFENQFQMTSEEFFSLYQQGKLDNGEHRQEFSEWAGFCQIQQDRQAILDSLQSGEGSNL